MAKKRGPKKVRVDFRRNRGTQQREGNLTRRYEATDDGANLDHLESRQSVRSKGALSRKRTVIVGDDDRTIVDEARWLPATVTAVLGPECNLRDDRGHTWRCSIRRVLRTLLIGQRSSITAGDRVWFSDQSAMGESGTGVIERVDPRRTILSRSDFRGREHAIVANADQLLIVSSVARPNAKPHLIDRYLVAAARGNLRPVICFNKCDLARSADATLDFEDASYVGPRLNLDELMREYAALGYTCLEVSAVTGAGLEALRHELCGHITVFSGQSGVGKSSLANAIEPGLQLKVADVSAENQKGRHTTSYTELLALSGGGFLVDTPGIRQFSLWAVAPSDLEACFVEFPRFLSHCRFKDCHHIDEAGCAILAAVEKEIISPRRYDSYRKMLLELAGTNKQRYD